MALARNDEGSAQRVGRRGAVPLTQVAQDFFDDEALVKGRPEAEGCRLEVRDWGLRLRPAVSRLRTGREAAGWRGHCLRSDRSRPFKTLEVSTLKADSSRCAGSARKPRRQAKPTWYSTSRAEP